MRNLSIKVLSLFLFSIIISIFMDCTKNTDKNTPAFYVKGKTWFETMLVSNSNFYELRSQIPVKLSDWYSIGPFQCTNEDVFTKKFEPENTIDLHKNYGKEKLNWVKRIDWSDDTVNFIAKKDYVAHYIYRAITAEKDTNITISLGSDDGIKLWLNNALILANDVYRDCGPDQENAVLNLKTGENKILMRINNGNGPSSFYFSLFEDNPFKILWNLIRKDFKTREELKEMTWENSDNIWNEFYDKNSYSHIAKKYIEPKLNDFFQKSLNLGNNLFTLFYKIIYHGGNYLHNSYLNIFNCSN